ncbi:YjbH domain-containing protein [Hippea sp. KM1]|uniref:YjbH domain-containing protein n=1 Tax=Hippea sp. KM1 TaxID=944481 RepID=UPI00046D2EC6|nr:YjbH domain-containing protein [Hippea sp. KM1]
MKKALLFLLFFALIKGSVYAADSPFNSPSNYGISGLMAIPNARVMKKNRYRFGASFVYPYWRFYGTFSPLKRLELNGLITDIIGVKGFSNNSKYGNYKDKDIDFKYQLFPEGKWRPAIAIGGNDLIGTRLYASQYLVFSKQIWPFDFTIGLGNGRYGKKQLGRSKSKFEFEMLHHPIEWFKDSKLFWGIEFAPTDRYSLMVEYNPTEFHNQTKDPATRKYFKKPVKSHYNFGLRWKPRKWIELDLSYQRGERFAANLSANFNIGKPLIPIYDPPYVEPVAYFKYPIERRIALALQESGFSNIMVKIEDKRLYIVAENTKYFYQTRALGVVLNILKSIHPKDKKLGVSIILERNFIPEFEFTTTVRDIVDLKDKRISKDNFLYLSKLRTQNIYVPKGEFSNIRMFDWGLKPNTETFLNDPSGFFKYRAGISLWGKYFPWKGGSVYVSVSKYFLNNISTVNKPLSIPVRSDIVLYEKQNFNLDTLLFNQIFKVGDVYFRGAVGLLEYEYAGIDAEVAKPLFDGKLLVGLGGSLVKKRSPDRMFAFADANKLKENVKKYYAPFFLKARINFPSKDLFFDIKAGRFLAGDYGCRFQISKDINGVILSAWYSITNTSVFHDSVNRGYHDYGISLSLPIRLFKGEDSKVVYDYSLSPWTRDVAQDIKHHKELFNYMRRTQPWYLYHHGNEIFK